MSWYLLEAEALIFGSYFEPWLFEVMVFTTVKKPNRFGQRMHGYTSVTEIVCSCTVRLFTISSYSKEEGHVSVASC